MPMLTFTEASAGVATIVAAVISSPISACRMAASKWVR